MHKLRLGELTAYLEGEPSAGSSQDAPVIVLLHGFGAPGTDLLGIAGELELPAAVRWAFPMAPIVLEPRAPEDFTPRAWWHIDMAELQVAAMTGQYAHLIEREPEGLASARQQLQVALDALCEQLNVPFSRLVLGGFSQGGGLATDLALHSPKPPGALAILSGAVVTLGAWRTLMSSRRGLKVFHSHGVQDPVLPFATAEMLRDAMVQAELGHSFVPFRGGHTIPAAVMERFGAFLRGLAAAA